MSPSDALYNVSKLATSLTKLLRKISDRGPARNFEMDGSIQTSPIFNLPDEMFIEILSYFATFKLHELYYRVDQLVEPVAETRHLPREHAARHQILLTLTQVCHGMRKKFSPWLLEHVQSLCVYTGSESDGRKRERRLLARKSLLRQVKVLVTSPPLAAHVRTMSIHLHYQTISSIAQCLVLLPNLHTLEVTTSNHSHAAVEGAFQFTRLPQVRTLAVDPDAHHIIRCCGNLEHVVIHRYSARPAQYIESIACVKQSITHVSLCAFELPVLAELARSFPELRELSLVQPFHPTKSLEWVSYFERLQVLELVLHPVYSWGELPNGKSGLVLETQDSEVKNHAIAMLKMIHGHTKVFKMVTIGQFSTWDNIQEISSEIVEIQ